MTTLYQEKIQCALCGSENTFTDIGSTNTLGSADLDTRPPEMERSTIFTWVQRCSECGYCSSDVSKSRPGSGDVVNGSEYRKQLNVQTYPELTNSFLCKAIIDREAKDYVGATWALVHAAWACDDNNQPDKASACRHKAADMLKIAEDHGQIIAEQDGASTALLVDLLRRSGRNDDAQKAIEERRTGITEDIIVRILNFQEVLVGKSDLSCHSISEALGEDE
jgi:Uncharacterized protein conserved in bacteria (DUF2225)